MAVAASIKGVTDFLQEHEALIETIKDTAKDATEKISALSDQMEANRKEAERLVDQINGMRFEVARDPQTKLHQAEILDKIEKLSKKIQIFRDKPDILIRLYAQRSDQYALLTATFQNLVGQIVTFSEIEVDELRVLLRRATLDIEFRKHAAHVLDAAVQVSKLLLRVAVKLVA